MQKRSKECSIPAAHTATARSENGAGEVAQRAKPKKYVLEMFPYPSGDIHMGHVSNYTYGDVLARFSRMKGFDVLHPMGWDAFGLPAENAAIKHKSHPAKWTYANIDTQQASFQRMGFSYDWDRKVVACDPEYYRWGQWIFLKFWERGLVERRNSPVNWCPELRHRARQRAGHRGPLLALRFRGREARPHAVVLQDHRLRAGAARRPGPAHRLARAREAAAGQLDRPLRRRRGRVPAVRQGRQRAGRPDRPTTTSPCSPRVPTRCSAAASSWWRPNTSRCPRWWPACPTSRPCSTSSRHPRR